MSDVTGYCTKCRASKAISEPTPTTLTNGRHAIQGVCPTCGTKMFRFVKAA